MAQSLIKSIRSNAQGLEDIALQGYSQSQVTTLVNEAFGTPIPSNQPLSLRFVVGGGKKVRQKYSDSLPKEMNAALQAIGYQDDKSASLSMGCQGLFKYHHDTGEDLKRIIVFPKLVPIEEKEQDEGEGEEDEDGLMFKVAGIRLATALPKRVAAAADQGEFVSLVVRLCPTFFQRRALLRALKEHQLDLDDIEQKMGKMQQLNEREDVMYSEALEVHDKIERLTKQMEGMLQRGHLGVGERRELLKELEGKKATLRGKLQEVSEDTKKAKTKAKLEQMLAKLSERTELLETAPPYRRPPAILAEPLAKLVKIESNSLTMPPGVERRLAQMRFEAKGWFADQVPPEPRTNTGRNNRGRAPAASRPSNGGGGGFTQVASRKKGKSGGRARSARSSGGVSNGFAGLSIDED